ncbi:MAG: hypothetical protein AB1650_08795 [Candidatus Omnitrophota bacterium]
MREDVSWERGVRSHKVIYELAREDLNPELNFKLDIRIADSSGNYFNGDGEVRDSAMFAGNNTGDIGGIDLDPRHINMRIRRDENNVPLPVEFQDIDHIDINGFTPVIINITPVTTLPVIDR